MVRLDRTRDGPRLQGIVKGGFDEPDEQTGR